MRIMSLTIKANSIDHNPCANNITAPGQTIAKWLATIIIGSATLLTGCKGNNGNTPCLGTTSSSTGQALIAMQAQCNDLTKSEKEALDKYVNPSELNADDNFTNTLGRDVIYEFAKQVKQTSPENPSRFSPEDIGRLLQILPEHEFKNLERISNQLRLNRKEIKDVVDRVIAPFSKNMTGKDIVAALEILDHSPQKFEYLDKTTPTQEIERGNNILTQAYLIDFLIPKTMKQAPKDWSFADVSKVIEHVRVADYSSTEFKGIKHWEDAAKSAIGIIQKLTEASLSKTDTLRILNIDAIGGEDVGKENLSNSVHRVASLIERMKTNGIEITFDTVVKEMKTAQPPFDPLNTKLTPSPDPEWKDNYTPIPAKIQKLYDATEQALWQGGTKTFEESFAIALDKAPDKAGAVESILYNLEPLNEKPEEMKQKVKFTIAYIKNNYPQALNTLMFTLFTGRNSSIEKIANQGTLDELINAGANPAAVDRDGYNIPARVSYFRAGQDVAIRKLFENYGVKINILPESRAPSFEEPQ